VSTKPGAGQPPSELYLALESKGSEILSGLHIEIIAAAASFVHLHLDGEPVVLWNESKSLWQRMRDLFKPKRKPGFRVYPHG
jgi:hypothetical protein